MKNMINSTKYYMHEIFTLENCKFSFDENLYGGLMVF